MYPVLFRIPVIGLEVPGYGFMLMIGFLLSVVWAARRAARSNANPDVVLNCAFLALAGGVIGSRIMYVAHYWDQFALRGNILTVIIAAIDIRQGGLEVYGGVIGATVAIVFYLWRYGHSIRWYVDIMAPSLALGMGIGRLGCFLNGCCWGATCELPWAVRFPYGSNAAIQQWQDGQLDLPQQLLLVPPGGIHADGDPAYLLSRTLMIISDRDLEQAEQVRREYVAARTRLASPLGAAERKELLAHIRQLERKVARYAGLGGCALCAPIGGTPDLLAVTEAHGLTIPELRRLAEQYPAHPVHPTQLYSAFGLIALALFLSALYWRRGRDGVVISTMLVIEPWSRYLLELLRADNPLDTLGFTVSQFIAIVLSLLGVTGLILTRYLPARSRRAQVWIPPPETTRARPVKPGRRR